MSKTIAVSDNVHVLITRKQTEIFEKYRVTVRISDLADILLKNSIDRSEELLGLSSEYLQPDINKRFEKKIKNEDKDISVS